MLDSFLQLAVLTVFPAAMVMAALSDVLTMTISNRLTVGLALAFFVIAPLSGMSLEAMAFHAAAGLVMLVIGIALFAPGWIGGGDAKVLAATALWLGWGPMPYYVAVATLSGCLLTIALLTFRGVPLPSWVDGSPWVARLHRADNGAPYCVALAFAGLVAYPSSWWFTVAGL